MQNFTLRKAERKQSKIRVSMSGPSGSGKTYSALLLAKGLTDNWNKIALIDTENKRGDLYSDLGEYNIITLEAPFTPERFIDAIATCKAAGMEVIIIDSLSHEWEGAGGCLESNEKLAASKYKGNTWAAWNETTPRHQRLISAIIATPCHIINTMRSKTDVIQTEDKKIKKVGLKPIQREGFEYEMTISFDLDRDTHCAVVGKDNTHLFEGKDPFVIIPETGVMIKQWSESGVVDLEAIKTAIFDELTRLGRKPNTKEEAETAVLDLTKLELKPENYNAIVESLNKQELAEQPWEKEEVKEPTPAADVAPVPAPVAPEEPEDTISARKIELLRALARDKEGLTDDKGILEYISFFQEQKFESLEDLPISLGNKVIKELMEKKVDREEEPETGTGSEVE